MPIGIGTDFWCRVEGSEGAKAQAYLAAALDAEGPGDLTVCVLSRPEEAPGRLLAVLAPDRCVGMLPPLTGFSELASALYAHGFAGVCLGEAFEERGRLGLRLNIDRTYASPGASNAA